jgi:DNA replicative helicase MCM subunit Mcm2 (Cdc46/Mcm family)
MRSHPNNTSHTISEQDNNAEEDIKDENDENEKTKANLDTIIVNQSDVYKNTKDLNQPKPIDQDILKKYITYARAYIKPVLHDVDSEKVIKLFFFP